MSVFSMDTDEERASNIDVASDCDVAKDENVSQIINKFLQEHSECEAADDDISMEAATKGLSDGNSISRSNCSQRIDSDEDVKSSASEISRVKSVSSSSASFRHRTKPISSDKSDSDESDASISDLRFREKLSHGKSRASESDESDASDGDLRFHKKLPRGKSRVLHDDGFVKSAKKPSHRSIESDHRDKTSAYSKTKKFHKEYTENSRTKDDNSKKKTKLSDSGNNKRDIQLRKHNDEFSEWNVGNSGNRHVKSLNRHKSDISSDSDCISSHSEDEMSDRNSVFQKRSSDKQHKLEKSRHADKNSHNSKKFCDTDRSKEKSAHNILQINSKHSNHNKNEPDSGRKLLFSETEKRNQFTEKDETKQKSCSVSGTSRKGLSFFYCTTSSSVSSFLNPSPPFQPEIRKQRSSSPVFVKVKVGGARVFVESELQNDQKLWQNCRVDLTNCDNLVKMYRKKRKLDDLSSSKGSLSHSADQRKADEDKRLIFSKDVLKSLEDGKIRDHHSSKKSKDYDKQLDYEIKHLNKEAHNLEKHDGKSKGDRASKDLTKQLLIHKHSNDKSDDKFVGKTSGDYRSKSKGGNKSMHTDKSLEKSKGDGISKDVTKQSLIHKHSDAKSNDKSVSKNAGDYHSKDKAGNKSMHADKSHDRHRDQSKSHNSHHRKSVHVSKSHHVSNSKHERKSDHESKSHHHSKDSLHNKSHSFVKKESKEEKSSRQSNIKKSDLHVTSTSDKKLSQDNNSKVSDVVELTAPLKHNKKGISYIVSDGEEVLPTSNCDENIGLELSRAENKKESLNSELKAKVFSTDSELSEVEVVPGVDKLSERCEMYESKILEGVSSVDGPELTTEIDLTDSSAQMHVSNSVMFGVDVLEKGENVALKKMTESTCGDDGSGTSVKETKDSFLNDDLVPETDTFCNEATQLNSEVSPVCTSFAVATEMSICPDEKANELQSLVSGDVVAMDVNGVLSANQRKFEDDLGSVEDKEKEDKEEGKRLYSDLVSNVFRLEEPDLESKSKDEDAFNGSKLKSVCNNGEEDSEVFGDADGGKGDLGDRRHSEATKEEIISKDKQHLTSSGDEGLNSIQQVSIPLPNDKELINTPNDVSNVKSFVGSSLPRMTSQFSLQNPRTDPLFQPFVKLNRLPESVARKLLSDWQNWLNRRSHIMRMIPDERSSSVEKNKAKSRGVDAKIEEKSSSSEDFNAVERKKRYTSLDDVITATKSSARCIVSDEDCQSVHSLSDRQENERKESDADVADPVSRSLMKVRAEFKRKGGTLGKSTDKIKKLKHDDGKDKTSEETDYLFSQKRSKISSFVIPKVKPGEKNEKKRKKPPQKLYETVIWTPPPAPFPRVRKPPQPPMRALTEEDKDRSVLAKVEGVAKERENFHRQTDDWNGNSYVRAGEWRRFGPPDRLGDRWNRKTGPYGREQGNWNRDISKGGINGGIGPERFSARDSQSSRFQRNVNSYNSQSGDNRQMTSNGPESLRRWEKNSEKKENTSMEWIRLYNRDPLGLMSESANDDKDDSFSPPGVTDDGGDDDVIRTGNRYETKSTLFTDDSTSMLENVKLLTNTVQEVLTGGSVSAEKRQQLSDFHAQLQKNLILPSSAAHDNLSLLNMICDSLNQAKNFVSMFQNMMHENLDSMKPGTSSGKASEVPLDPGVLPKAKGDVNLSICPSRDQTDNFSQRNIGTFNGAAEDFRGKRDFPASVQQIPSPKYLFSRKSDSVHSPASVSSIRNPQSAGFGVSDVAPRLNSTIPLLDIDERINKFKDIDERKSFLVEPAFSRRIDDRTAENDVNDRFIQKIDNSVVQINCNSKENVDLVDNQNLSYNKNEKAKAEHETTSDISVKEMKSEAVKSQEMVVNKIEDEMQLLEMLVTIQRELAEVDSDTSVATPSIDVSRDLSTVSEITAPIVSRVSSTSTLSKAVLNSPAGQTLTSSLADDGSEDSMQSSVSRKELQPKTPNDEPKAVDPKILEDKVIGFARNALKPYYHRGVITSEEFKLIMRKVISKVQVKTEEEIKEAKIAQLIGAYVERIVSQRKKIKL